MLSSLSIVVGGILVIFGSIIAIFKGDLVLGGSLIGAGVLLVLVFNLDSSKNQTSEQSETSKKELEFLKFIKSFGSLGWSMISLSVFFIASVITCLIFVDGILGFSLFLISILGLFISGSISCQVVYRSLADRGWFVLRIPDMHAAFLMKDGRLWQVIINCSKSEELKHYKQLALWKNSEYATSGSQLPKHGRFRIINQGSEIIWVGFPWIYKLIDPWYEYTEDQKNPKTDPQRFLDLRARTIDYKSKSEGGPIDDVDSADPIQIKASMVVEGYIYDPEAALFSIGFFMEAVQKEILTVWREVVPTLSYFSSKPEGSKDDASEMSFEDLNINPEIQKQAFIRFNSEHMCTGRLFPEDELDDKKKKFQPYSPKVSTDGTISDDYPKNSPAHTCCWTYGFRVKTVRIVDIDPADQEIRKALDEKSKAKAKASAAAQTALGEKKVLQLQGEGKGAHEEARGKGEAARWKSLGESLKSPEAQQALAAETAVKIAEGSGAIVTEGGVSGLAGTAETVLKALQKKVVKPKKGH